MNMEDLKVRGEIGHNGEDGRSPARTPPDQVKALIQKAMEAKQRAYCPYSKFRVGAALLVHDGTVFTGCNVENACYGLCLCAERNAMSTAVSEGYRSFMAIAIAGDTDDEFISACGSCRQFMSEFGLNWEVYSSKTDGSYVKSDVSELLPGAFELKLKKNNIGSHIQES